MKSNSMRSIKRILIQADIQVFVCADNTKVAREVINNAQLFKSTFISRRQLGHVILPQLPNGKPQKPNWQPVAA